MSAPAMPRVLARGRWWSADELDAMARSWRAETLEKLGDGSRLIGVALPAAPEAVALFAALISLPSPLILLNPDVRAWRTEPAVPPGTPVVLIPSLTHLGPAAEQLGLVPVVLGESRGKRESGAPLVPFQSSGVVLLTSGSTGSPRPAFRPLPGLLAVSSARIRALALHPGAGILMGVSLASGQALNFLLISMLLGGALGLLEPLDHRAALDALARPDFQCWRATPHFADVLSRCALTGPAITPPVCLLSSPISRPVFDTFLARFGVPLRQTYSSSETGLVALDNAPAAAVRADTVGHPLAGVEVSIGDHPASPRPPGEIGRIWIRSPWQMAGYGFPPVVERPGDVDGWWPTRDLGFLEAGGHLALAGRLDDCIRTRENRLVNLAAVATVIRGIRGVRDAAVVPLGGPAGSTFGAVVQCELDLAMATVRTSIADVLPPWSWPRAVELVRALPRLPNGKADRRACITLLEGTSTG
jgi:acyl-CoA synthetase (AMP-forming)/AMP-acid ligase II